MIDGDPNATAVVAGIQTTLLAVVCLQFGGVASGLVGVLLAFVGTAAVGGLVG